ncbi:MAG: xanthine dehydrogenase [Eubacterium sp.]|nr:xanthine dehydrogenase [Eubacterium sp.]
MTEFYKQLYLLNEKEKYVTAQVVQGEFCGLHAIFTDSGIFYREQEELFWEEAYRAWKTAEQTDSCLPVNGNLIYVETMSEQKKIVICGAGHVSVPVIRIAKMLGFYVSVIDDRKKFVRQAEEAGADQAVCGEYREALSLFSGDRNTFFVIVTRGHQCDRACLEQVLTKTYAYVGMIGSRKRVAKQMQDMIADGYKQEMLKQVHAPIGLCIGAQTAEEIAVSIMAEVIQEKNKSGNRGGYSRLLLETAANQNPSTARMKKAVLTIVAKHGSGPRDVGTKMVVSEDGSLIGTIGGGALEADLIRQAFACMEQGKGGMFHYEMNLKEAEEEGMACGGEADVFIDIAE